MSANTQNCDTRFKKKSGKYPVKLSVTFQRKPRQYQTIYDLSIEDWDKLEAPRIGICLQEVRQQLVLIELQARDYVSSMDGFSFEEFEKCYILDNPLFRQRKRKNDLELEVKNEFDVTPYKKKFPILDEKDL